MTSLLRLPTFADAATIHVVVESPRGSTVKLKYDPPPSSHADLVYSDAYLLDAGGQARGRFSDGATSTGVVSLESLLAQACTVLTSSIVARRETLVAAGLFDPSIRRGQDFELWLRLARAGASIQYTTRALLMRRVHPAGLSGSPVQERSAARMTAHRYAIVAISTRARHTRATG